MNNKGSVKNFFNVADETLSSFISDTEFDSCLVHHILFQENILIDEGFLGDSSKAIRHMTIADRRGENSLLLAAISAGIMIPALREPGPARLFERFAKIYGEDFPILRPENGTIQKRLLVALEKSAESHAASFTWPDRSQKSKEEEFEVVLRKYLQSQLSEGQDSPDLLRVWDETKDLRFNGLEEAKARTRLNGKTGISRTEIVNVVGDSVGIRATKDGGQFNVILQQVGNDSSIATFFRWVTQGHHLAQANFFNTAVHFPVYRFDADFIAGNPKNALKSIGDTRPDAARFYAEVTIPPPEKLAFADAEKLLDVRKRFGEPYFMAISEWAYSPNDRTSQKVKATLEDYAAQLSREFSAEYLYSVELSKLPPPTSIFRRDVSDWIKRASDMHIPGALLIKTLDGAWQEAKIFGKRSKYRDSKGTIDIALPHADTSVPWF